MRMGGASSQRLRACEAIAGLPGAGCRVIEGALGEKPAQIAEEMGKMAYRAAEERCAYSPYYRFVECIARTSLTSLTDAFGA